MKSTFCRLFIALIAALISINLAAFAPAGQDPPAPVPAPAPAPAKPAEIEPPAPPRPPTLREMYDALLAELQALRQELAQARLDASEAEREAAELRQFIADHDAYGKDFDQYKLVKQATEQQARKQAAEAARQQREAERLEKRHRALESRAAEDARRIAEQAEQERLRRYQQAGFDHLGSEIFLSRMSYQYRIKDVIDRDVVIVPQRVVVESGKEFTVFRPIFTFDVDTELDFSSMIISGSMLNATSEPRRIGVGIAFFSEDGTQIGGDTIEVHDARPDTPYPFSRTIAMAYDFPFYSYRINVLYSDPAEPQPVN